MGLHRILDAPPKTEYQEISQITSDPIKAIFKVHQSIEPKGFSSDVSFVHFRLLSGSTDYLLSFRVPFCV